MRKWVHILSNKVFALHRIKTLRVLHVLRFDRMWKTGIAFPYSETKKQI